MIKQRTPEEILRAEFGEEYANAPDEVYERKVLNIIENYNIYCGVDGGKLASIMRYPNAQERFRIYRAMEQYAKQFQQCENINDNI